MNDENNKPRAGVSRSFIFSIFLVLGIIALVAYFIFSNSGSTSTMTVSDFVNHLYLGEIKDMQLVSAQTQVAIHGRYIKTDSLGNKNYVSYSLNIDTREFETQTNWYIDINGDGAIDDKDVCSVVDVIRYADKEYSNRTEDPLVIKNAQNPYETSWWDQWGPTIVVTGVSALIMIFLLSRMSSAVNSSNRQAMDFNRSRAKKINTSKVKFDDVAGADEEKAEMQELVYYLKDPRKFTKFGAKLPKGVLLVGPPGCGKTLLAKAVAGEAGVPFFSISGSDFVEMFVGVGAGRVRDMFKIAKENAPCLVFIDEIDAVGRQRGAGLGGGNDEREQTLNQLLVEMDGFNDNSGIIVIAATNRDDVLDPALLRAGRFDRKITVSLPDKKGREAIFKVHARNKFLEDGVNFENLARRTVGFSGADIENIMNEAAILAVRANREKITIDDIDEAIDRRIAGPAKSSRSLSMHEKEMTAYHEAGHAIIGLKYPNSNKVQKITIIPRGNYGGYVLSTPEDDKFTSSKKELIAQIVGYMGGRASEEVFCDDISNGASNDIQVATSIARAMVCEWGMSDLGPIQYERDTGSVFLGRDYTNTQKNFSIETATKIDNEIRKIIDFAHKEATRVINENKDDVILLAKTLIEHEQITAEEIDYLMEHRHLKRDENKLEAETQPEVKEEPVTSVTPEAPAEENK
ncbi:MAG: ATP-dependent zinc metalloprotease FtsH [Bacilli bacterium]|nr:ATP-dependent zinc metalloprotease FtsH [Bacilli bacterium]